MKWNDSIQYLKGVGPKRAALFLKLDINTVGDLLTLYPRSYVDYSAPVAIAAAPFGERCAVKAEVTAKTGGQRISGGRSLFKVFCADETGSLEVTFFNNPYVTKKLEVGREYIFYGKIGGSFTTRELVSPSFIPAGKTAPMTPIYPLTAGLSNYAVESCVQNALQQVEDVPEVLDAQLLQKYVLPGKAEALKQIHMPSGAEDIAAARRRLIFEELYILQLGMLMLRGNSGQTTAARMKAVDMRPFLGSLPFNLTGAQNRAVAEICADMINDNALQMNRLLQGDVGSGKTMVAAAAIYLAAKNGYQSALMAPTEILSRQHAETLEKTLSPLGISVALVTGSVKGKARKTAAKMIQEGAADLVVGTHALLSEDIDFSRLGLVITDEQHRFGVRQRGSLSGKAQFPHTLVMSATPIPRTLALLMFGDLDVSVLDELPPGRKPVKTYAVTGKKRRDMFAFLQKQIDAGRQIYIVTPLIEEGENDLQAAARYYEEIACPLLPNARVALMHGRLKPAEKSQTMDAFKRHEIDVLVSTTVIEVGVDVPNANVMVIEDAERYGLSALHQLRGRVGRGAEESYCVLVSDHAGEAARERLRFLCHTHDGFEVAKYDLATRGPGDFFGNRQHGLPVLKIADLAADTRVLKAAQQEAIEKIKNDPGLKKTENAGAAEAVAQLFSTKTVMN